MEPDPHTGLHAADHPRVRGHHPRRHGDLVHPWLNTARRPRRSARSARPDIAAGLIYRLMTPMTEAELAEQQRKIDELSDASDESDEEAMDDEREDQEEHSHRALGLSSYTCNCEVCARVRVCLVNYHAHEPVDQLAQLMKRAIDETCKVHNIHVEGATQ